MCLTFKEQTSRVIFRSVVPFANRLANLRLADWSEHIYRYTISCQICEKVNSVILLVRVDFVLLKTCVVFKSYRNKVMCRDEDLTRSMLLDTRLPGPMQLQ